MTWGICGKYVGNIWEIFGGDRPIDSFATGVIQNIAVG